MENAVGATNYRASPVSVLLPFHLISFFAFAIASPPLHVHVLLPCSDKLSALFMSAKVDVFIYLFAGAGFEVMAKFVTDSATLERARCFLFYFARVICEKVIKKKSFGSSTILCSMGSFCVRSGFSDFAASRLIVQV